MMKRTGAGLVFFMLPAFFSLAFAAEISYDSAGRRDPFIPLIGPNGVLTQRAAAQSDLKIEGIIYDPPQGSLVLVNGEFYKQGDVIGDAIVISIFQDRVILSQSDEEKTIWIREEVTSEGEINDAVSASAE